MMEPMALNRIKGRQKQQRSRATSRERKMNETEKEKERGENKRTRKRGEKTVKLEARSEITDSSTPSFQN